MKKTKLIVSLTLSTLMLVTSIGALAEDGDIFKSDGSPYGNKTEIIRSKAMRREIMRKQDQYLYELNNLRFFYKDVANAYNIQPDDWKNEIVSNPDKYKPEKPEDNNTREFMVISID